MQIVRHTDFHHVDVFILDYLMPVSSVRLVAPPLGKGLGLGLYQPTDNLQDRLIRNIEEVCYLVVGIRVRPAHKAVSYQSNIKFFSHFSDSLFKFLG